MTLNDMKKQAEGLEIEDESAVEALLTVLNSRKNRANMVKRLKGLAGTNPAHGAEMLRIAAAHIEGNKSLEQIDRKIGVGRRFKAALR